MHLQTADAEHWTPTDLPAFDLRRVMSRVSHSNPDWSQERLDSAELGYRQYLKFCKEYAAQRSPSRDADELWHCHILFTRQYMADCIAYFGRFLHHVPFDREERRIDGDCDTCCQGNCGECRGVRDDTN